ncbi:MAG: PilZ domain-containing protein [Candidatus Eremiobacteraeota bacterium]|nr:PilZ domain-containing protein [Candidatus Eremiobacteraeota bacterium]
MSTDDHNAGQQRQFYRAEVDFSVTLRVAGEDSSESARAHDLSGGGMRVSMERHLDRGQPVELRFHLPGGTSEVGVRGLVVLSFYEGSTAHYHHGVAFTSIGQADREAIVHYIHDVQRRSLKGH